MTTASAAPPQEAASAAAPVRRISGLGEIAPAYDLFLVDQWGVLHNGQSVWPAALDALRRLRRLPATVIILSNSGKRAGESRQRLEEMGVSGDLYDHLVTSGEIVHRNVMTRPDDFYRNLGQAFYALTWDAGNLAVLDGAGMTQTATPEEADFIFCSGTSRATLEDYLDDLRRARARNLPMLCANPDRVSVAPDGSMQICPGTVAAAYQDMGGQVRWHGKPFRETYALCRALAPDRKRILGIGDSLQHDIAGAQGSGGDGLLVLGGIHGAEAGDGSDPDRLDALFGRYGVRPAAVMPALRW